ncbi:MAG TPA: alpha/beta hydrolase [Rhizomicrobium sp.]|jgi:pimeloyl-ACP methyl ester carboxylesterase
MKLQAIRGGEGADLLVLLHGLGTTGAVWQPMLAKAVWKGSWLAPDLRGHGASPHAGNYALGQHAADVADLILDSGAWNEVAIVGHSMGGVVALALASGWFGVQPSRVLGLGIKVAWTGNEIARLGDMAAAPVRHFLTEQEALARFLKVSGLAGLVTEDSPIARSGVSRDDHGWRLAADPMTARVGAPPTNELARAVRAPIHLARGQTDAMVTLAELETFDAGAVDLPDCGHNAMVENPAAVWNWIGETRA